MKKLIVLEGPTGVGKTTLAIEWALKYDTEIISADSRQFYKELNIGVARPSIEELNTVQHHFIANLSIQDYYSIYNYEEDCLRLLEDLFQKKDVVILCGGSGLYVNAICNGVDLLPDADEKIREDLNNILQNEGIEALQDQLKVLDKEFYDKVDLKNPNRLIRAIEVCLITGEPYSTLRKNTVKERPFEIERFVLNRDREILYDRINQRVDIMLEDGLLDEVRGLFEYKDLNALKTVGYREIFEHYENKVSLEQAIENIKISSRRYAKRQLTWLRRQENITWINI